MNCTIKLLGNQMTEKKQDKEKSERKHSKN